MLRFRILNVFIAVRMLIRKKAACVSLLLCAVLPGIPSAAIDFDRMQHLAATRYGTQAAQNVRDLRTLFSQLQNAEEIEQVKRINQFVNERIRVFGNDIDIWGKSDYWATPLESLGREAGDCEDYSISKYLFLRELGISNDRLRLIYVRAQIGGPNSRIFQAHMVLGYYETPNAEPLILDNLIGDIRVASRRTDLKPIFGFNSDGLWVTGSSNSRGDSSAYLSRWRDLLERAKNEGIE